MTLLYDHPQPAGGTRVLILGCASYPNAQGGDRRVPVLDNISSAAESALALTRSVLGPWSGMFAKPLSKVEALINHPNEPGGVEWMPENGAPARLDAPTLDAVVAARGRWLADCGPDDTLIFYCCGHGIWLPRSGRTFLAADFGQDPDAPWGRAIALDDFQLALGEKAPRAQWLIYDCCANTPTEAMRASPNPAQLLTPIIGARATAEQRWGILSQVRVAAAPVGALAYGREGQPSRFIEALMDACKDAGFQCQGDDGRWWIDPAGLIKAFETFALRQASPGDETYYTFPRAIETDAASAPGLLVRDSPARCTVLVQTVPGTRLQRGNLTISVMNGAGPIKVAGQDGGPSAVAPFRWPGEPYVNYRLEFSLDGQSTPKSILGLPPLVKVVM